MKSTYTAAGVNISEGDKFVEKIKPLVKNTFNNGVISGIGNFGAFFNIPKSINPSKKQSSEKPVDKHSKRIEIVLDDGVKITIY